MGEAIANKNEENIGWENLMKTLQIKFLDLNDQEKVYAAACRNLKEFLQDLNALHRPKHETVSQLTLDIYRMWREFKANLRSELKGKTTDQVGTNIQWSEILKLLQAKTSSKKRRRLA